MPLGSLTVTSTRWMKTGVPTRPLIEIPGSGRLESAGPPALRGLAANPAAPEEVLRELLRRHPEAVPAAFHCRPDLPATVIEQMRQHPDNAVRAALAGNPGVDPAVRESLGGDPSRLVRDILARDPLRSLPDRYFADRLDWIAREPIPVEEAAAEVGECAGRDRRAIGAAARHESPLIRRAAVEVLRGWNDLQLRRAPASPDLLHLLAGDQDPGVREAALEALTARTRVTTQTRPGRNGHEQFLILGHLPLSPALVDEVVAEGSIWMVQSLAANPNVPLETVAPLIGHSVASVRARLAERDDLDAARLARLAADPDVTVRTAVSVHPGLSERQRAGIEIEVPAIRNGARPDYVEPDPWREEPPIDSAWARSVNPLLRRRAARDPGLPAELVPSLAADPDPGVRLSLAHHHPAAPPELLLRVFREHPFWSRGRLPLLPNFPSAGLAALAEDPDPGVRALAARDPRSSPDRLLEDPDEGVRAAMASSPHLPVERIIALLGDPVLAEPAAANPALPLDRQWSILADN